jgi:aldehyde reductase
MPLNNGGGHMPALGFGNLIPDVTVSKTATRDALVAGFRHFDCAERYRNEREVGEALQWGLSAAGIAREDIFVTTKLWNTNHRPERVEPPRANNVETEILHSSQLWWAWKEWECRRS